MLVRSLVTPSLLRVFGVAFFWIIFVNPCLAVEGIEIVKADGKLTVSDAAGANSRAVKIKDRLPSSNILSTDGSGRAVVRVGSTGYVVLEKNSKVEINIQNDHAEFFRHLTGIVYYGVNNLKKSGHTLEVRTATATLGIRGTRFLISDIPDRYEVGMRKGSVSVSSVKGEFEIHLKATQDEFEKFKQESTAAVAAEKESFEKYKDNIQHEFVEFKKEFALDKNRMVSFDGKRVDDRPLGGQTQKDMETLEGFASEWLSKLEDKEQPSQPQSPLKSVPASSPAQVSSMAASVPSNTQASSVQNNGTSAATTKDQPVTSSGATQYSPPPRTSSDTEAQLQAMEKTVPSIKLAAKVFAASPPASSLTSVASKCDGASAKPVARPDWIDSPESVTEQYFFAAGVSDNLKISLSERIALAKQNALANLSGIIETSVKNSIVLEQSNKKISGHDLTDSSLLSITKTSTNASLRNVEVIATWTDPSTCSLWVRARVSMKYVEQGKREGLARTLFGVLTEQLAIVQNDSAILDSRLTAVDAALEVLPRIALEFIPEASSASFYTQLLNRFKNELTQTRNDLDESKFGLLTADQLVSKVAGMNNESEKSKSLGNAANIYRTLLAKHGNGLLPIFEPGDILFKLGEVEELRGSSCGAKNYFQQAADARQINDRREIARKKSAALSCSAEDMEKTLWRQFFDGRSITLICYFDSKSDHGTWNKACDGLNNVIGQLGANVTVRQQPLSKEQLSELKNGEIPRSLGEQGKLVLGVIALGDMKTRDRQYQFDGAMTTFLIENGTSAVFKDRFQGVTGWNPISPQMVMDVLGINVVKRWHDKFSKFLRHDLSS